MKFAWLQWGMTMNKERQRDGNEGIPVQWESKILIGLIPDAFNLKEYSLSFFIPHMSNKDKETIQVQLQKLLR